MAVKTPLSHLTNNCTFTVDLDRIEEQAYTILTRQGYPPDWPEEQAQGDATTLMLLVNSLVADLHRLNKESASPQDLCPRCGGRTWSRPGVPPDLDFSKRKCERCGTIRKEFCS